MFSQVWSKTKACQGTLRHKGHCSKLSRAIGARIGDPNDQQFAFLSPCWQCRTNIWAGSSAPTKGYTWAESREGIMTHLHGKSTESKVETTVAFSWCPNICQLSTKLLHSEMHRIGSDATECEMHSAKDWSQSSKLIVESACHIV